MFAYYHVFRTTKDSTDKYQIIRKKIKTNYNFNRVTSRFYVKSCQDLFLIFTPFQFTVNFQN